MSPKAPAPVFTCSECGWTAPKWVGRCAQCGAWGTVEELGGEAARPARGAGILRADAGEAGRELATWLVENKLV